MDSPGQDKPLLTREDAMSGSKIVPVVLVSGEDDKILVRGVSWKRMKRIHFEHRDNGEAIEAAIMAESIQPGPNQPASIDDLFTCLDMESRLHLQAVCMEFAYGFQTQKKRREAAREILKLLAAQTPDSPENTTPSPSASETVTAAPTSTDGACPP